MPLVTPLLDVTIILLFLGIVVGLWLGKIVVGLWLSILRISLVSILSRYIFFFWFKSNSLSIFWLCSISLISFSTSIFFAILKNLQLDQFSLLQIIVLSHWNYRKNHEIIFNRYLHEKLVNFSFKGSSITIRSKYGNFKICNFFFSKII